jgi:hypothetical protein
VSAPKGRANRDEQILDKAFQYQKEGWAVPDRLESVADDDPAILTEVDILHESLRDENIFFATNLTGPNGDLFHGFGALVSSGSHLDPFYRSAAKRRARKRIRRALEGVGTPRKGERWWLLTLTLPKIVGVDCGNIIKLVQRAWALLRKRRWWLRLVRAGIKAVDFALSNEKTLAAESRDWDPQEDGYHVHLHLVVLSELIPWQALGDEWTTCLEHAGLIKPINTLHGRVVVDVRPVACPAEALGKLATYITKTESLRKISSAELYGVQRALKGQRTIELLGECRRSGSRQLNVHTNYTSDGQQLATAARVHPRRSRRKGRFPLRKLGTELIGRGLRDLWQLVLRARFAKIQRTRRALLAARFPLVTLRTLDGNVTYGVGKRELILETTAPQMTRDGQTFANHFLWRPFFVTSAMAGEPVGNVLALSDASDAKPHKCDPRVACLKVPRAGP